MNKIKNMFSGMINSVKEALNIFPITTIIVFVITLITTFLVIGVDFSDSVEEMIAHICVIGAFTACGTWFTESLLSENTDKKRIIGYVISLGIGILFDRLMDLETVNQELLARWMSLYVLATFLISVYVLMKKANVSLEKYALNLILNVKRASIVYGIVAIGFLILYAIFVILILEDADFEIYLKLLCMFTGFYYVPVVLKAFSNEEAEDTKFNRAVFSKVLLPLLLVAMLIVYVYLVKIFLVTEVPKNQLFGILSMIFVCAFPLYVVNKNYMEKGSIIDKINRAIPYLFTPFIFLQIYSMGIRIKEYGLTESRYMAVILIIFETIAIGLAVLKNSKYLRELVLATLVISVIVLVSPFNVEDVPLQSQKKIVDKYVAEGKAFDSLNEHNKRRFAGAYQYIDNHEELINPNLSQLEKEKLSSYSTYRSSYNSYEEKEEDYKYVSLSKSLDKLNISSYANIYEVPYTFADESTSVEYPRVSKYGYVNIEQNEELKFSVDLKEYIEQLIEANENSKATADRTFEEVSIIKIDDSRDLYLTELSFKYYTADHNVENLRIEGFVFER